MDLNGKNFLIIGGAGFIGSYLVKELLKTNVKKIVDVAERESATFDILSLANAGI